MKLGVIIGILAYWFVFAMLFFSDLSNPNPLTDHGSVNYAVNSTQIQEDTTFSIVDLFTSILSFFGYVLFGVGVLPSAPLWLQFLLGGINSLITLAFVLACVTIVTDFIP